MTSDENYRLGLWAAVTVVIGFMALFLSVAPANAQISMFEWAQDQQERYDAGLPQRSLEQFEADVEPVRPATDMIHYGTGDTVSAVIGTKEMDELIDKSYTPESGKFVTEDAVRATEPVREQLVVQESQEKVEQVVDHYQEIIKEVTAPMGILESLFAPTSPEIRAEVMSVIDGSPPNLYTGKKFTERMTGNQAGNSSSSRSSTNLKGVILLLAAIMFVGAWIKSKNPYKYHAIKRQVTTAATYIVAAIVITKII